MFRRIINLWRLSNLDINLTEDRKTIFIDYKPVEVKKKRKDAVIVETENPLDKLDL